MVERSAVNVTPGVVDSEKRVEHCSLPKAILLAQGAEGRIYKSEFLGVPCVVKERFLKRYRHPTLDKELVARRLVAEARTMVRGRKYGVDCPVLYFVDRDDRKLYMEYVDGISLKEFLDQKRVSASALHTGDSTDQPKQTVCHFSGNASMLPRIIGQQIARLHNSGIIHGDLTPSNIMLRNSSDAQSTINSLSYNVVLIDFGLSSTSVMVEDKAVDLYVLERALKAYEVLWPDFVAEMIQHGYLPTADKADAIRRKLNEVRQRGRKRLMIG